MFGTPSSLPGVSEEWPFWSGDPSYTVSYPTLSPTPHPAHGLSTWKITVDTAARLDPPDLLVGDDTSQLLISNCGQQTRGQYET